RDAPRPAIAVARGLRGTTGRRQDGRRVRPRLTNHAGPDRGLRAHRRLRDGGARVADGVDRLALLAALRLERLLRRAPRRPGARAVVDRAARPESDDSPALP